MSVRQNLAVMHTGVSIDSRGWNGEVIHTGVSIDSRGWNGEIMYVVEEAFSLSIIYMYICCTQNT